MKATPTLKMRKLQNFCTQYRKSLIVLCMGLILLATSYAQVQAQCALACNDMTNISTDTSCAVEITADMILEGPQSCPDGEFMIEIFDYDTLIYSSPRVTEMYLYKKLKVLIRDTISGNTCWGHIIVEDKFPPIIDCEEDITLGCYDLHHYPGPDFRDNCDPFAFLIELKEDVEKLDCDPDFIKIVTRYYTAEDNRGNRSLICRQNIHVERPEIDSVVYPKDFIKANDCALYCNRVYKKDDNGHPHPDVTGVPELGGAPLWPFYDHYCNLSASYRDRVLTTNECHTKIMREWTVLEWWCGRAVIRNHLQIIEILDIQPPQIQCIPDMTITTSGGYQCEAEYLLPAAWVYDSCSHENVEVEVHYPGGFLDQNGGWIILPVGNHSIVYTAYDECYNSSTCEVNIYVRDHTPPVTVCDQHTTATLNETGEIHVYAETFDDGSFDDCHLDSFAVKRMDDGVPCGVLDTNFMSYVRFCCADAGQRRMVIFRAYDKHGNYNDCMVEVLVQDKLPPRIWCPGDLTIDCPAHIDTNDLSDFGEPTYTDNCNVRVVEKVIKNLSQCMTGTITRRFIATDNGGRQDSCEQVIYVKDPDPFEYEDITWPEDYTSNEGCAAGDLDPDDIPPPYDRPIAPDDKCSLIGMSYEDHVFNFVPDTNACFKILRKWKVIDWCQKDRRGKFMVWEYEQIIKVNNTEAPVILSGCEDQIVCTFDPLCQDGFVELIVTTEDDCTPVDQIVHMVEIDINSDGVIDSFVNGFNGVVDISGDYPIGLHKIKYSFEDRCGNKTVCVQNVQIMNCKAPTAYCLNGIAVELMEYPPGEGTPDAGMIEIWASDFDAGSTHPCGNPLIFSFSENPSDNFRTFNCDSVGRREVTIHVIDRFTGLMSHCNTYVIIQDNRNICDDNLTTARISGAIFNEASEPLNGVEVNLEGSMLLPQTTDIFGKYAFPPMERGNNYQVVPSRGDDWMNGVSTKDILIIQKHLLGMEALDSPYKLIASDVDGSGSVSAKDLIQLRKLILGKINQLDNNESWRFVESDYHFPDPENPWSAPFPEEYKICTTPGRYDAY